MDRGGEDDCEARYGDKEPQRRIIHVTVSLGSHKAIEQMYKYLLEFGLTPVSRTRVSVAKPGENDVLEDIMQQAERLAREKGF